MATAPNLASDATGTRGWPGIRAASLAAKPEPCDDGAVARVVLLHEVRKKAAALANELEESAARMVVLREALEMPGQLLDPLRQERDLDLRRTGVTFSGGEPGDDLLLLFPRERHSVLRHDVFVLNLHYDRRMVSGTVTSGKRSEPSGAPSRDPVTGCSLPKRRRWPIQRAALRSLGRDRRPP